MSDVAESAVIKASIFLGLSDFVATMGLPLDVPALLREFGFAPDIADNPDIYVLAEPVSHLFERAAARSGHPCFGLEYARHYKIGASGSVGYLMAHAPTFRIAVENLVTYIHSFTRPIHMELVPDSGGTAYLEWVFPLEYTAATPQYVSFALGAVIQRLRVIAGPQWTPLRLELIHRELPCREIYLSDFGARVRFDAPKNRMWFDPTTLALKNPDGDPNAYRIAMIAALSEMAHRRGQVQAEDVDIKGRVRSAIESTLGDGAPELDKVAAILKIDGRRLQYLLEQQETSFSTQLSETRRALAERLLTTTDISMSEIAISVGFAELSSFTRAARGWFGMSPSQFRERMRSDMQEDWSVRD